ncbi:type III secretion system outer membrane ring subunit SctC [Pseudomonas sp. TH06]|uniref:type III secretion system outer membrane ring subunit SctC n=1 Tax=Pseudomonas sp. TH06 TaxID=2796372 RepID=UPI001914CED8|nr:type III secretion system outer membrane ring subunit SctC [Pseudomonas sp. TH06]MBK5527071.1 type III secretion system outer membrane ring subunit SctC [Pseudomonas sp. TH06]
MASLSVSRFSSLVLAWLLTTTAYGQDLDWPAIPYNYVAQGENLRDVLANFGANYDGSVIVSDKVNDQVSGRFDLKDPQSFLQLMASLYNLIWYYDGAVLYVFKSTEMQSRLVKLEQVSEAELRQALEAGGVWEPRFGWRPDMSGRLVYISGPSRYLDLVEQTAMALEQQHALRSEKTGDLVVEIFPLKYAVAEDRRIKYREDDIEAPGVATILARVLGDANVVAVEGQDSPRSPVQSGRAVVQAEPSLNAILVRDTKERMPMYRRLITALDRPSARIEVGLSIVDINAENLAELGVDWRVGISVGPRQLVDIRTSTENLGGPATTREAGASLVDSRGLDFLLARITLLQNQGRAQIGSRPTVLTQENTLAVIDHSETYYVRLIGERVAELRPITYGTMLKLTPRVIQLGDKPEISLSLHIEDGNQKPNSSGPGGLPTIARTVVDTVARVGHGQSLLIGGIYRDELSESMRKVPLLGDIPYLGALFRFKSSFTRRSVRLFLIEPRLIDNGLGHFVALGSKRGYMDELLQVDELSNQSLSLQKLLGTTQCQALGQARELQQILAQAGKDSSLTACVMGNTTPGWRISEGACVEGVDQCVRAPEKR